MKYKAKVVGIRDYDITTKENQRIIGQNVFVTYFSKGVTGQAIDTFKNCESKSGKKVPKLEIGKEYVFSINETRTGSKSIDTIQDLTGKELFTLGFFGVPDNEDGPF